MPGTAAIVPDDLRAGPDWAILFGADGAPRDDYPYDSLGAPLGDGIPDYKQLSGGKWVVFATDDISLGTGFEGTALNPEGRVYNATVEAEHDIGNAYVYWTSDSAGNAVLFAAAERLGDGDSFLEFEFNQDHFRLGHGGYGINTPWQVVGKRQTGDVIVHLTFADGALAAVTTSAWNGATWQAITSLAGEGCNTAESLCAVGNRTYVSGGPWQSFDPDGVPGEIGPNRFVEFGVNVGLVSGGTPEYETVCIRTPQDIAFGYFAEGN